METRTATEAPKEFLKRKKIEELLQAVITALLIDRPENHFDYLVECMNKAKELTPPFTWKQFVHADVSGSSKTNESPFLTKKIIFIFGGPGSGKGTQSEKIAKKYGFAHLSTGDLLRAELDSGSELGKSIKNIMDAGQLVPMESVLELLRNKMTSMVNEVKGYLIDGYPRELIQAEEFEKRVAPCTMVIYLKVSDDTMTKRLMGRAATSGRSDDGDMNVVNNRISVFKTQTFPVLDHYKKQNKVFEIDSEKSIDDVFSQIETVLDKMGD